MLALVVTMSCSTSGCGPDEGPAIPQSEVCQTVTGPWGTVLGSRDGWTAGQWLWSWTTDEWAGQVWLDLEPLVSGTKGWQVTWRFQPDLPDKQNHQSVYLVPFETSRWHAFHWLLPQPSSPVGFPLPIPRLPVQSEQYSGVLELLQELTTPHFNQVVTHWPEYPIPLRLVPANNGPVDLAACLTEAMETWNEGETRPWFKLQSDAGWGVRLVHFPDRHLRPPLAAQITRLDSVGRPLRIHLLAGDNYDDLADEIYAKRGFVHELGHALFLWGHSGDRLHSLWGQGPPLVNEPSSDERKAARWWHGLPQGLDLTRYETEESLAY